MKYSHTFFRRHFTDTGCILITVQSRKIHTVIFLPQLDLFRVFLFSIYTFLVVYVPYFYNFCLLSSVSFALSFVLIFFFFLGGRVVNASITHHFYSPLVTRQGGRASWTTRGPSCPSLTQNVIR